MLSSVKERSGLLTSVAIGAALAIGGALGLYGLGESRKRRKASSSAVYTYPPPAHQGLALGLRVLVATRIHGQQTSGAKFNSEPLRKFLAGALTYADAVLVAVEAADVFHPNLVVAVTDVTKDFGANVYVLPVTPWGRFAPALNAALSFAAARGFSHILYQSLEVAIGAHTLKLMKAAFDPDWDLVVGAALEGHEFRAGQHELSGVTSPWNTLALWSVPKLAVTGFLAVSDGLLDSACAGIEEVAAITVAQAARGPRGGACAKVVKTDVRWEVSWDDPARQKWHKDKMQGKVSRAQRQLQALGMPPATVLHVEGR